MENLMLVYLDNCCFNRPFDDQKSLTIRLETEAKLDVQERIKTKQIALAWSYILDFENSANPFIERKIEIQRWRDLAETFTSETDEILKDMEHLTEIGVKPLDALHLACAISLKCDYFLTVDKGIINKADRIKNIRIMNPVSLIFEWE
jgi:predicted nucleic acid-binding protein